MLKRYLLGLALIGATASLVACTTTSKHADNGNQSSREIASEHNGVIGYAGRNGYAGGDGYAGSGGQNQVINVSDGKSLTLSAVGGDASNGGNGQNGENASDCSQPVNIMRDVVGAPGGNGGPGGMGGTGGHGGDSTIYYTSDAQLRNVFINAAGGRGGIAGNPAGGGQGCRCERYSWRVEHQECPPAPKPVPGKPTPPAPPCRTVLVEFRCSNGRPGGIPINASSNGLDGAPGQVVIIKSAKELPADAPSDSIDVANVNSAQSNLLMNNFATATGMIGKLQGGSVVQDEYQYFTRTIRKTVTYKWSAETQPGDFAGQHINVYMDTDGTVTASAPVGQAMLADINVTNTATGAVVEILHAANSNTFFNFDGEIIGDGAGTELVLTDKSGVGSFVGTDFNLNIRSGGGFIGFIMVGRYNGRVDPQFITPSSNTDASGRKVNTLTIAIGKLPGIKAKKLWANKKIKIATTITRTLGGQALSQTLPIERRRE